MYGDDNAWAVPSELLSSEISPIDHLESETPLGEVSLLIQFLLSFGILLRCRLGDQALRVEMFTLWKTVVIQPSYAQRDMQTWIGGNGATQSQR